MSMGEEVVLLEKNGAIATITLNRPSVLNAVDNLSGRLLMESLFNVQNDDIIRVVIITGAGKAFCAGGDLEDIKGLGGVVSAHKFMANAEQYVAVIMNMEKPVIAMVNGAAAGFGFNLALACDIVYCGKSSKFVQSFVNIGLVPDGGGMYLLPRIVGMHMAKELMFTGRTIDADMAYKLGIVNQVVEDEQLKEKTYKLANKLVKSAPVPIRMIKRVINKSLDCDLETILERERDLQTICFQTEDHKEGVLAFLEKRNPVFIGK